MKRRMAAPYTLFKRSSPAERAVQELFPERLQSKPLSHLTARVAMVVRIALSKAGILQGATPNFSCPQKQG